MGYPQVTQGEFLELVIYGCFGGMVTILVISLFDKDEEESHNE